MAEAENILTNILNDTSTCSRCFAKTVTTQQRGALGHTPCSDNCGTLGLSMESNPIPFAAADRRAKNLLERLNEHDITINQDAFNTAVQKQYSDTPPKPLFLDALKYGLGHKDPTDLEPDPNDAPGQPTDAAEDEEDIDPIDHLSEAPIAKELFDEITIREELNDCVGQLETPESMTDIIYISHQPRFREQTGITDVGDHDIPARADAAVHYNSDSIQSNTQRIFGRWLDDIPDSLEREVLSAAIMQIPGASIGYRDDEPNPLRESAMWPVVKERVSQRLLGLMQRNSQEYFTTQELCNLVSFRDPAVERVIAALEWNDTITRTEDGWVYSGDEVEFDEEQAEFWQDNQN